MFIFVPRLLVSQVYKHTSLALICIMAPRFLTLPLFSSFSITYSLHAALGHFLAWCHIIEHNSSILLYPRRNIYQNMALDCVYEPSLSPALSPKSAAPTSKPWFQ